MTAMPIGYVRRWRTLGANVRAFLVFDICYQLALTVYGLYFPRYLLALGYAEDTLGSLMAVGTACVAVCSLGAGILSDRIGRRRSLLMGISISKSAFLLRGFVVALPALYGCYVVDGVFMTMYAAAGTPFIFENTHPEERIHAFSMQGMIVRASGIIGNTIGGFLPRLVWAAAPGLDEIGMYRVVFVLSVVLAFVGVARLLRIREERPADAHVEATAGAQPQAQAQDKPQSQAAALAAPERPREERRRRLPMTPAEMSFLVKYCATSSLVAFAAGHFLPFMNTYLIRTFDASAEAVGGVLSFAQFATIVGIAVAPALGERFGITPSVLYTRLLALPMLLLMAWAPSIWIAGAAYALRNSLHQMSGPLTNTFMLSHLSRSTRATANGFLQSFENGVRAVSMFTSGLVITRYGYPQTFIVAFMGYALSAVLFWQFFVRGQEVARERSVTASA